MDGDGVAMTRRDRAAVFTPITWEVMYERARGPGDLNQRRQWCQDHCGVERADWDCRYYGGDIRWRFRDPEQAFRFKLTWMWLQ